MLEQAKAKLKQENAAKLKMVESPKTVDFSNV
jgi:hypothetical protein